MTIIDILKELGIPYKEAGQHHHVTHGWVGTDCPTCSPGWGHYRLGFRLGSGGAFCWACGRTRMGSALAALSNRPMKDIYPLLKQLEYIQPKKEYVHQKKFKYPPYALWPLHMSQPHSNYAEKRGLDVEFLAARWNVMGMRLAGMYSWRLFIPITLNGTIVSWTTRTIDDTVEPRYQSCPAWNEAYPHKHLLYGEEFVNNTVIVCEGPVDVWKIGPGAVATFGTAITSSQKTRILEYPRRVICLDSTAEGQSAAGRLMDSLGPFPGETINVKLESGKDPGEASKEEILELRKRFLD